MKLATSLVLASTGLAAAKKPVAAKKAVDLTASQKIAGRHARKLVRASRKLEDEDNEDNQEEEDEYYFLTNYRMKFVQCVADYKIQGDDAYESSAVIYRLCPNDAQSESAFGCTEDESYGDYVVGINTYTEAIAENMREEAEANGQEDDDEFDLNEYAQCGEADMEMDEDEDEGRKRKLEEVDYYYIGPKCVNVMDSKGKKIVGTDIALDFFADETCTTEAQVSYYELTGQEIPYSTGLGLYQEATKCASYNEDGELEIKEVCQQLVEDVAYRCDAVYQGGCEKIEALEAELKASEAKMSGGKVFGIVLLVFVILGAGYYFFMKKKQKDAQNSLLNN
mmetsp:Transcript_1480/g.4272  ORF Transcript_1480/g.4272 Transcript_1480/m.4272 type:complete len:337 (-) Transcript_1480:255-1265(-)